MDKLKEYNESLSAKWNKKASESNAKLFFALAANDKNQTILLWDNQGQGNEPMIDYLKHVIMMMEQNSNKIISNKIE